MNPFRVSSSKFLVRLAGVGILLIIATAEAATYSMTPGDAWSAKLAQLQPGDTLLLQDGTYGPVSIDCASNTRNGTASAPITLKAEHERKVRLATREGMDNGLLMANCSWWVIEGLHIGGGDYAGVATELLNINQSHHMTLRRLLLHHNNRYHNTHLVSILYSTNIVVEESELYSFHRHAILNWYTDQSIYRRVYCNSRAHEDISVDSGSHVSDRGDGCISIYPGNQNILENVISEGNYELTEINGLGPNVGNKVLGSISLDDYVGGIPNIRDYTPRDVTFNDFVVIRPLWYGLKSEAGENIQCHGCTMLDGRFEGIHAQSWENWSGSPSFFATNTLVANSSDAGFFIVSQSDWAIDYSNAYGNGTNYSPYDSHVTNSMSIDPKLGSCKVWIPDTSPMKRAGRNGADIGGMCSIVTRTGCSPISRCGIR